MMKLPPLKLCLNNVVVGWREEAIAFAWEHGYHLIVNSDHRPFHYQVGHQEVKSEWFDNIYSLGMSGLLPVPFDVATLALEGPYLKVVTQGNTKVLVEAKSIHIFDMDNFNGLEAEEVIADHKVYDMFDITQGSRLGADFTLLSRDTLIQSIKFVTSNRIDRNTDGDFKDIVVRSIIPDADLKSFDFSETVVRILVERKLKEHNITSTNGAPIKVNHSYRHITKNKFYVDVVGTLDPRIVLHG